MRIATLAALAVALAVATPAAQTYEVVSIKRNTSRALGANGSSERPDGGFTLVNITAGALISRAYPGHPPVDLVNLPGWAMSDRYDVSATSPLSSPATPEQRTAMMRAMLADRFKLAVHFENRDQPVYDLVLARPDKRLGPSIKPSEVDCLARDAAERAAQEAARAAGKVPARPVPPPFDRDVVAPCTRRRQQTGWEGDFTMEMLARLLRIDAGRLVIDKTGMTGSYRLALTFEQAASGPDIAPSPTALPSVFVAVQEQLGLKLEPSTAPRETLIIDRLERPTEN